MIKSITATNYLGEATTFELNRPEKTGIYIRSVDGLGPTTANINTTELSSNDGSVYNSARLNQRNIVLNFGLMFNPMIEDMRHKLYRLFPLKKPVRIDVETDRRSCYTIGYVETNNPDIFNKDETQQVSIICPTPWFYGNESDSIDVDMFSISKNFEFSYIVDEKYTFPWDSITDSETGYNVSEFGIVNENSKTLIVYHGDDDTGMVFNVHFGGVVPSGTSFRISDTLKNMSMKITLPYAFFDGDSIIISTVKGDKYVKEVRNPSGTPTNAINLLDRNSDWLYLTNGNNNFMLVADSSEIEAKIRSSIHYNILYAGV